MSLLFLLFSLSLSTLSAGENPYDILGVSKFASADEIKKAFRKIVFEHHPDRHKDEESYRIFLKANDAYELLSDQEKKLQYDRDGKVNDHADDSQNQNAERRTPAPLLNQMIFPRLARDGSEWIILITQHFDCPECHRQEEIFEDFQHEVKHYVKVGKIDATSSPDFIESLGVNKFPQWFSVRYINETVHGKKIGSTFRSKQEAIENLFKFWHSSVQQINSMERLKNWLNANVNTAHVLEVLPRYNDGTSIHFRYAASKIGKHAIFGTITESEKLNTKYGIKKTPCVLVFRGLNTPPMQITTSGRRLLDDIEEYTTPIFTQISWRTYESYCKSWCVVSYGIPNISFIEAMYDRPFITASVQQGSSLAKSLNMSPGKWVAISKGKYLDVDVKSADDLISLCSKIYRNDGISNEGVPIPKNHFFKAWDGFIGGILPFEVSNGNITFVPLMISIPIPILLVGAFLLFVFLFVIGITNNTKVETIHDKHKSQKAEPSEAQEEKQQSADEEKEESHHKEEEEDGKETTEGKIEEKEAKEESSLEQTKKEEEEEKKENNEKEQEKTE